ncbi:hypothetical protein [Thermus tengchongensis]|uniref:hypothetical protein n=1 Tax=Thermus tengchongensis TaxID=1214928 RepID=UPI001F3F9990|nr:hypothetical protein [Thermus tengchongensis]
MERLDPHLVRYLRQTSDPPQAQAPKGKDCLLYVHPLPGERQMRAAYEVVLEGFLEYLETQGYPVVGRGESWVRIYLSPGAPALDLKAAWGEYLEKAFSLEGLSQGLLPLLNSVRLAEKGISAPKVPIVTLEARDFLAAWYLASLLAVRDRLEQQAQKKRVGALKKQWDKLEQEREQAAKQGSKSATSKRAILADWALEGLRLGAKSLRELWLWLDPESPKAPPAIRRLAPLLPRFGPNARKQLKTTSDKFPIILKELLRLLSLENPEVQVPPLLADNPFAFDLRKAGDKAKVCYSCSRPLDKGKLKASKLIFSAPSHRLQSGTDQEEPEVCPSCAALALLSPIKLGTGSVLVRIGTYEAPEAATHFVRLFTTGTLHVAAGRYLQLNGPPKSLGRLVFALQVLGREANPKVLKRFTFFLVEGAQEIPLPKRALWLSHVLQRAFAVRPDEGGKANRDLGQALRYALADLPWHGLYTLVRRYGRVADRFALEEGLKGYATLLEEVNVKENAHLAQRFRDVAGLTGLLSAWVGKVESKVGSGTLAAKRAVVKLLDNLQTPGNFLYVAAYELDSKEAKLSEAGGTFFYQEAKRLLEGAGGTVQEEEKNDGRYLSVSQDDLHRAYAHLAVRYPDKAWKGFIYEVRLSLASRFPQYIRMGKED